MNRKAWAALMAGAVYDVCFSLPLAIPLTTQFGVNLLFSINHGLGLAGTPPVFDTVHLIFVSLFGLFATCWGVVKFWFPSIQLLKLDVVMRVGVMAVLALYALTKEVHGLVYIFIVADLIWLSVNLWGIRQNTAEVR